MLNSAFSTEPEAQLHSSHSHMVILHRRQTERLVLPGILFVADTNEGALEQLHHYRQDLLSLEPRQLQIDVESPPNLGQGRSKDQDTIVFVLIANRPPAFVIPILFSSAVIASGCLNMTIGKRTNPNLAISWWNREASDSKQARFIANQLPLRIEVLK